MGILHCKESALPVQIIISKRGKQKLVYENHLYLFSKKTRDNINAIWVCEKRSTCKGRVWTEGMNGEVIKVVNLHNHAAQAARPEAVRLVNEVCTRARTTQETPQQILAEVVSEAHANVAALLPRKDSLKRSIRAMRKVGNMPRLPQTIDQLNIPQEFREINIDGTLHQFLLWDSVGTGKGCFRQLPETGSIKIGFSMFDEEFPNIEKTGCFFHLSQSVWRKVQNEGLKARYQNDHEFSRWIRMIPSLAFLPPDRVTQSFEDLLDDPDFPQEALPIANYFEDTYIGRINRRGRQAPLFPIQFWNVYQRTLNGQHRTNNDVEGWHRSFQETCGSLFPNIYRFINCLKRQQGLHNFEMVQVLAGNAPTARNKKYAVISARVLRIVEDLGNRNLIDYLRGIAYNFEF
ncbi:hypothetical protein PPYR_05412 [Photinus pyralis]|uniref:FLYWCH-type domain-containing protein n=1 Tax=Photinus pyralis TaxID=7054 RepID=A0A5N4AUZ0_PHOPY|nr:hypothetical protein PPYR_05412 [Photinus pyralis]